MNKSRALYAIPYYLWLIFFVVLPMGFILIQSFISTAHKKTCYFNDEMTGVRGGWRLLLL